MPGCFKAGDRIGRDAVFGLLPVFFVASACILAAPAAAEQPAVLSSVAPGPNSGDTQVTALTDKPDRSAKDGVTADKSQSAIPETVTPQVRTAMLDSVVVDAREYPWSAIGRVNTGGRGYCTGILVDDSHVLTDAHCLFYPTEGRWWQPGELHFVAGYQRDSNLVHSRVTRYELAPGYRAHGGVSLASILNNWALIQLEKPLGHQTGWLGMRNLDKKLVQRLKRGRGALLQAGYRRDAPHAITLGLDCGPKGFFSSENRIGHRCQLKPGRADLPFLVYMEGRFNLVANHVMASLKQQPPRRGVLSNARLRARLMRGESRAPRSGATKGSQAERETEARRRAIRSFETSEGLPVTGTASLALLGRIFESVY